MDFELINVLFSWLIAVSGVSVLPPGRRPIGMVTANLIFLLLVDSRLLLLLGPVALAYFGARALETISSETSRRWMFAVLELGLILPLVFFKWQMAWASLVIPLGLSFCTLQLMGYLADVYRRSARAEGNAVHFLAFGTFFPLLPSGPLERSSFIAQFKAIPDFDESRVLSGATLTFRGVIKVWVIAGAFTEFMRFAFRNPQSHSALELLLALVLARFVLFYNLSGVTDIARGLSHSLGFSVRENFARPLLAPNITEFWRRWHMSVSTWFRDYVFYPLLTTRVALLGLPFCVVATFLALGLWHGFTANYILFGLIQGGLVILNEGVRRFRAQLSWPTSLSIALNYFFCLSLPMILLETETPGQAAEFVHRLFTIDGFFSLDHILAKDHGLMLRSLLAALGWLVLDGYLQRKEFWSKFEQLRRLKQWGIILTLIAFAVAFGSFSAPADYGYRNF